MVGCQSQKQICTPDTATVRPNPPLCSHPWPYAGVVRPCAHKPASFRDVVLPAPVLPLRQDPRMDTGHPLKVYGWRVGARADRRRRTSGVRRVFSTNSGVVGSSRHCAAIPVLCHHPRHCATYCAALCGQADDVPRSCATNFRPLLHDWTLEQAGTHPRNHARTSTEATIPPVEARTRYQLVPGERTCEDKTSGATPASTRPLYV
jgi:hypothetical protein